MTHLIKKNNNNNHKCPSRRDTEKCLSNLFLFVYFCLVIAALLSFGGFEGYSTTGRACAFSVSGWILGYFKGLVGHFCSAAEHYAHAHNIAKSDALQ